VIFCLFTPNLLFADEQITPPPVATPEVAFTATKTSVVIGEPVMLTWKATNATRCESGGEWGYGIAKPIAGSETVVPKRVWILSDGVSKEQTLYHYYLYCFNGDVRAIKSITLTADPSRDFLTLSASQKSVKAGELVTLTWSVNNADRCVASKGWVGEKSISGGTELVTPEKTTTYALQCFSAGSSVSKEIVVSASARRAPVITSFSASKSTVAPSESVKLSWKADALQCLARDSWTGVKDAVGTESVMPTSPSTNYTIECTRDGLLTSRSIQVSVVDGPANMSVSLNKTIARDGEPLLLSWSADSVDSCERWDNGWSTKNLTGRGSVVVYPSYSPGNPQVLYTVRCTRLGVTAGRTVTVTVQADPFLTVTADPLTVEYGKESKFSWSAPLATRCVASGAWSGEKQSVGEDRVTLKSSGSYTLECFVGGLSAKKSVFVGMLNPPSQPTQISFQQPPQSPWPPLMWGPNQQPFGQGFQQGQPSLPLCRRTGCSGEICSDHDMTSVCSYLPEYACYQVSRCELLLSGTCGWAQTADYNRCVSEVKAVPPSATPQVVGTSVNMGKMSEQQQVKKVVPVVKKSKSVVKKPVVKKVTPKKPVKKNVKKPVSKKK